MGTRITGLTISRLQNIYITLQYKDNVSNKSTSPSRRLTKTRADDGNFWLFHEFALY